MSGALKYPHIIAVDIATLETIYADGRAMGRIIDETKKALADALATAEELKAENRTLLFRLKRTTDLYEKAVVGKERPTTDRGLPRHARGTKRNTAGLRNAAH